MGCPLSVVVMMPWGDADALSYDRLLVRRCSNVSIPWDRCGIDAGERIMEEILNVPVTMPHWWEGMRPYERQCPSCMPIWLLCPVDDTGSWDGGSALRLGSRTMLELINRQQWLLPGYELMCICFFVITSGTRNKYK